MTEGDLSESDQRSKRGTKPMPVFGSSEYAKPRTSTGDRLILGTAAAALATTIGIGTGAFEKTGEEIGDFTKATVATAENITNTIKMPFEGALDLAGKLIPDDEPDKARIPNYILEGKVEIKTSDALRLRQNPKTTGKADAPNELDWDKVKLANKKVVDYQVVYEPIDIDEGDTFIVENPELVVGQYTGGGTGNTKTPEEKLWLQLYTTDGGSVFVNFQPQTREYVHEKKQDPTIPSNMIKAITLQNSHGVTLVQYDQAPPLQTSFITVVPKVK